MKKLIGDNKYMVIEPYYSKGGINAFSGENYKRGFSIIFNNKEIKDNCEKYMPMDSCNFRIFVKQANRYSQKQYQRINDFLLKNKDKLFDMYSRLDKNEIYDFLKQNFKE